MSEWLQGDPAQCATVGGFLYVNSAFWIPDTQTYDIREFGLFDIESMSRMTVSRRPIAIRPNASFLSVLKYCKEFRFDNAFYWQIKADADKTIANRCWRRRFSP